MPALSNPRHEAFAQALFAGLSAEPGKNTLKQAYINAGYSGRGHSAEVVASRMLRKVEPIARRIAELQADYLTRQTPKLDVSRERVGKRLDLASRMAESTQNASAIVSSELGIAKVFGHITDKLEHTTKPDFEQATSLNDVGIKLLQSVGYASPSPSDVALALDAHAHMIEQLEAIAERAQSGSQS